MLLLTIYESYPKGSVMTKRIKVILSIVFCLVLGGSFLLSASAESENSYAMPEELLCISYRGDTAVYEANSEEAVLSAFSKGADFVSANIRKSDTGELLLCGENESEVKGTALKDMLSLHEEAKQKGLTGSVATCTLLIECGYTERYVLTKDGFKPVPLKG